MKSVTISRDISSMSRAELEKDYKRVCTIADDRALTISWYEEQFRLSRAKLYGRSSEQTTPFNQMAFFNEAESEAPATVIPEPVLEQAIVPKKKQKGHRESITKDLPTEVVEYRLTDENQVCPQCSEPLHEMTKEIRQELTIVPAQVKVTEHVRYIYSCRNCEKTDITTPIIPAPMPRPPIANSLASPSLLAHIMTRKYVDATPLYRQEQQFERDGIKLSRQTLANWMIKGAHTWLKPLYDEMQRELLSKQVLHADETVLEVLREPGRAADTQSYMWLYRTSRDDVPIVLYDYTMGRSGDFAKRYLKGFSGFIHTDGYAGYHKLETDPDHKIALIGCWTHARRKYDEALKAVGAKDGPAATTIRQGLDFCNTLFKLEAEFRDLPPEQRYKLRQEKSKPVLDKYFAWVEQSEPIVLPKSKLGEAITYSLRQRKYLENYLLDGRLELSNNRAERSIKPFVIGRKNWLFSNTPRGADASAIIYSIVETAKENGLNPFAYLQFLFEKLPNINLKDTDQLRSLLPWSGSLPTTCRSLKNS